MSTKPKATTKRAQPAAARHDDDNPAGMRTAFTSGGLVYVYDFDDLDIEPVLLAESVFNFGNQQSQRPPRDVRELELTGKMDILAVGMSYLLRRELADGSLETFDRKKTVDPAREFIRRMKVGQLDNLGACKKHFFTKRKIVDLASIMPYFGMVQENPELFDRVRKSREKNGSETSKSESGSEDSTNPASLLDDFEKS